MGRALANWELAKKFSDLGIGHALAGVGGAILQATNRVLVDALKTNPSGEVSDVSGKAITGCVCCVTFAEWRDVKAGAVAVDVLNALSTGLDSVNRGTSCGGCTTSINHKFVTESSDEFLEADEALCACAATIDGLRADSRESGTHDACAFDCLESFWAILITASNSLIDLNASGEDECFDETLGEVGFACSSSFVSGTECNGWARVANHGFVTGSANRASGDGHDFRRSSSHFLDQTDNRISTIQFGEIE